jgi:hypothetical protein
LTGCKGATAAFVDGLVEKTDDLDHCDNDRDDKNAICDEFLYHD